MDDEPPTRVVSNKSNKSVPSLLYVATSQAFAQRSRDAHPSGSKVAPEESDDRSLECLASRAIAAKGRKSLTGFKLSLPAEMSIAISASTSATCSRLVTRRNTWACASGASAVAIDNKIEQAMDLVKSHLMFAVREEVEVLKERIAELMERISQLELENTYLRAHASPDTIAHLQAQAHAAHATNKAAGAQPPANPGPPVS